MAGGFDPRQMLDQALRDGTRRQFFADCGVGLGSLALSSLLGGDRPASRCGGWRCRRSRLGNGGGSAAARDRNPLAVRPGHHPARAKSVIYLFMAGGPSQLELFDYQAPASEIQRPADPGLVHRGPAFRIHGHVHEGASQVAGYGRASLPGTANRGRGSRRSCRTWQRSSMT